MSTMSNDQLSNMLANAVASKINGAATPVTVTLPPDMVAEYNRLKTENDKLKAAAPVVVAPAPVKPNADAMLLSIIAKFKSPARDDGKVAGTFAVKVHSYFHAAGIPETRVREIIESACKRNVISRMTVPVKTGGRMMLYFDAKERPNNVDTRQVVSDAEKTAMAAAFGL